MLIGLKSNLSNNTLESKTVLIVSWLLTVLCSHVIAYPW